MTSPSDGWRSTSLGEVALSVRNGLFASRPANQPPGSPILRISAVSDGRVNLQDLKYVTGLTADQSEKYSMNDGDLLITRYNGSRRLVGTSGIVSMPPKGLIYPDKLIRVVLDRSVVDPGFVNFQMASGASRHHIENLIKTTAGQSGIAGADVRSTPLRFPELAEQRRIVDVLEGYLSGLDAADLYAAAAASKLILLRLGTLVTARRLLATDWPMAPLGEVVQSSLGKMLDAKRAEGRQTRYLRNINVRWGRFELEDIKSALMTDAEVERLAIQDGDLLVCEGGEPGRCAVWRGDTDGLTYQKALHRLRVIDNARIRPDYVALLLEESVRSGRVDKLLTGTTIKHLTQEKLRSIQIPIPPLDDQLDLERQVAGLTEHVERMSETVRAGQRRSAGLRRALLGAAFSGQLTGRSSDLDIAEELAEVSAQT